MNTSMKALLSLIFLIFILKAQHPNCLLQEPLTDQCLLSIEASGLEEEVMPHLCVIAIERDLLQKAEEFCKKGAPRDPESGYNYFKTLLLRSKFEEALKVEYDLFFADPFSHSVKLAEVLTLAQSTMQNQKEELSNFGKSIISLYTNKTQQSLQLLKMHLEENKRNNELVYEHFLMVRLQQKLYQYYEALTYITKVISNNKIHHPYFYHIKGNFQMHHINFNKAIVQFQKANQLFQQILGANGFSFSQYNIGLCYEKQGKIEDAIKYYEKSYLGVHSVEALNALGHASYSRFQQNNEQKYLEIAEKYYKKAMQKDDDYTVLIFNLGMLKLAQNQIVEAIQYFDKCLSKEDKIKSCSYGIIKAYYLNNQIDQAKQVMDELDRTEQTLTDILGILYELGYHKKALEVAGDKEDFKSPELLKWKGYHQFAIDKYEQAEKSLARAISQGGKDAYIYNALGQAQFLQRKYRECVQSLQNALKLDAHDETKQILEECKKHLDSDL